MVQTTRLDSGASQMSSKLVDRPRYKDQPWYMKIYLNIRYETPVPVRALSAWRWGLVRPDPDMPSSFKFHWAMAKGMAAAKKNDLLSWDEVMSRQDEDEHV